MAHTPGPWKYIAYDDDIVTDDGNFSIIGYHASVLEDDAHLIAAAPEMLEALEDAEALITGDLVGSEWKRACRSFVIKARAAIAKAKGGDT